MHSVFDPKKHTRYVPKNKKKYIGKEYPICRSGLEKAFCEIIDNDPKVVEWSSESFFISYMFQNKKRKYFPDFYVKIKSPLGGEEKWIVEIKSHKETSPPTKGKRKSRKTMLNEKVTWEKNSAKWKAARRYCEKLGFEFKIITEKHIFKK